MRATIACALLLSLSGCARQPAQVLLVSAAASLTEVMQVLEARFEAAQPGWDVRLNLGGSGALAQQIRAGAPVDVFASASMARLLELDGAGLLADAPVVFAGNRLVWVVGERSPLKSAAAALAPEGEGRVAIGEPQTVPAGAYARSALQAVGLWSPLQRAGRLVLAQDVRHALVLAERGEVELAAVYATDLAVSSARVLPDGPTPAGPIQYGAAVVRSASQPEAAARFVQLLLSDEGKQVLEAAGFSVGG